MIILHLIFYALYFCLDFIKCILTNPSDACWRQKLKHLNVFLKFFLFKMQSFFNYTLIIFCFCANLFELKWGKNYSHLLKVILYIIKLSFLGKLWKKQTFERKSYGVKGQTVGNNCKDFFLTYQFSSSGVNAR